MFKDNKLVGRYNLWRNILEMCTQRWLSNHSTSTYLRIFVLVLYIYNAMVWIGQPILVSMMDSHSKLMVIGSL